MSVPVVARTIPNNCTVPAFGLLLLLLLSGCTTDQLTGFKCAQPRSPTAPPSYDCARLTHDSKSGPVASEAEEKRITQRIMREADARAAHRREMERQRKQDQARLAAIPKPTAEELADIKRKKERKAGVAGTDIGALTRSAAKGNRTAQRKLGKVYEGGLLGQKRDVKKAAVWYGEAAANGDLDAQWDLAMLYETTPDLNKSWRAAHLLLDGAEKSHVPSQASLAATYRNQKQYAKSAYWYEKAAKGGSEKAQIEVADNYLYGRGVAKDPAKSIRIYKGLAQQGDDRARVSLAKLYERGEVVEQNIDEAIRLYRLAAAGTGISALSARWALDRIEKKTATSGK